VDGFFTYKSIKAFKNHEIMDTQNCKPKILANTEILLKGGEVAGPDGVQRADVRIIDEFISCVAPRLKPKRDAMVIDASGKMLFPGGFDPHTHLSPPFVDDMISGSAAALAGGITTLGTFSYPKIKDDNQESLMESLTHMEVRVRCESIADIILHPVVWPPSSASKEQLEAIKKFGQPSIKFFMLVEDFNSHIQQMLDVMTLASKLGIVVLLHCEDADLLRWTSKQLKKNGKSSLYYYSESRPIISELAATQQAITLCEITEAPTYIVHLSSARALKACRNPETTGLPIFIETRPIYLQFTKEKYSKADGPLFVGQPPLRDKDDLETIWEGLANDSIDVLATDHAPWTREQKLDPTLNIQNLRPGVNNLQVMLPMYFSEGVLKGKITIEQFVKTTSTNPAKIFGLYPRKGIIQKGSYADVVLWDPNVKRTISGSDAFSKAGFSIFEGLGK
jgi:dihydropyrimidinase